MWDGDEGGMARADAIIWATGFRPELRHLSPLKLREKAGGVTVGQGAAWNDPRVFLAGYGPQASTDRREPRGAHDRAPDHGDALATSAALASGRHRCPALSAIGRRGTARTGSPRRSWPGSGRERRP